MTTGARMTAALLLAAIAPVQAGAAGQAARGHAKLTMVPGAECPTVMMAAEAFGRPLTAAKAAGAAPAVALGARSPVTLVEAPSVRFAAAPGHAPARGTRGGLLALVVDRPGRYRVGLSGKAWIDVVRGTGVVGSVAHSHGDACSPIRKLVDFDLKPGRYLIQLSGSATPNQLVLVTRQS